MWVWRWVVGMIGAIVVDHRDEAESVLRCLLYCSFLIVFGIVCVFDVVYSRKGTSPWLAALFDALPHHNACLAALSAPLASLASWLCY